MTNNYSNQNKPDYNDSTYNHDFYSQNGADAQQNYPGQSYGQNYGQGGTSSYNRRSISNPYDDLYELEDETSSRGFITGAIIGGLLGAAAAIFLTPKTGKEIRQTINTQASTLKEKATSSSSSNEQTGGITQQLKEQSTKVVDKVKNIKGGGSQSPMDDGTASSEGEEQIVDLDKTQSHVDTVNSRGQEAFTSTANALKEAVEEVKEEKKSSDSSNSASTSSSTGSSQNKNSSNSSNSSSNKGNGQKNNFSNSNNNKKNK